MPIKSRMSLNIGQIESEHPELFALEFWKIANLTVYTPASSIYKYWPINTKLGQNVYVHKISDEFDSGSNWTRTV